MRAVRARSEAAVSAPARPGGGPAAFDRSLLLFALVLTAIVLAYFWTPTDPDVWWHLRNGAVVATTGAVPRGDIYSYTVPGAPWIMQQWLLETIMYGMEQSLGYWANVLLFALVSAGMYTLLFGTLRAAGAGRPLAVGAALVAVLLDSPTWGVRPQIWTTLFFVSFLAILLRYQRAGPDRWLLLLPPLMLVWANFHAGFSAGLLLLGAFIVGEAINRVLGWPAAPLWPLVAVTLACAAVSLLNPNGLDLWLYPITYLAGKGGNASLRFVQEWQPPDLRAIRGWPFAATLLGLLALNLLRRSPGGEAPNPLAPRGARGNAPLMLAIAGFTLMALQAIRFTPLYAVVWTVVIALRLIEIWPRLGRAAESAPVPPEALAQRRLFVRLNVGVYAVVALVLAVVILGSPRAQVHTAPLESDYPAGAVGYLAANGTTLPAPLHLFHEYGWGGYLIAHQVPVFVDGRADPYGNLLDDYVAASSGARWAPIFAAHGVNGVLVRTGAPLDKIIGAAPGWSQVYHDSLAVLYIKR